MTINKKEVRVDQRTRKIIKTHTKEMSEVYLKILDEYNDRIRSLENVILTLAETDDDLRRSHYGGLTTQELAKNAVLSYNIKCDWNKGVRK